jgi:transposase
VVFGLLERDGRVYTTVVAHVPTDTLMAHMQRTTRKDIRRLHGCLRSYQAVRRAGNHHTGAHSKTLVDARTKNPINGIEGFWSFAKHRPYTYRSISKYHFPMYLKEIESRFNHRKKNLFKLFLRCFVGSVSPKLPNRIHRSFLFRQRRPKELPNARPPRKVRPMMTPSREFGGPAWRRIYRRA